MRTLLIGVLAATLVGCSRQPSPQAAIDSCTSANGLSCLEHEHSRSGRASLDQQLSGRRVELCSGAREPIELIVVEVGEDGERAEPLAH